VQWWDNKFEPLKEHQMSVGQQWSAVVKAHTLSYFSDEQKEEIFGRQAKVDTSDTQKGKKLTCEALRANKEQFDKLYEAFKDPKNEQATSLKRASMSGWNSAVHLDWIEKEYVKRFFQDIPTVAESLNADAAINFLNSLQPCTDDLKTLIASYQELIPKLEKYERVATEAKQNLDVLERRQRAYEFFEQSKPKL
jgi:hypothetical protein